MRFVGRMRALASWAVYPLVMAAGLAVAVIGLRLGYSTTLVVVVVNLGAAVTISVLERCLPYLADWNRSQGDVLVDLAHTLFSTAPVPVIVRAVSFGALAAAGSWLSQTLGTSLWPTSWPLAAQVALALLVAEFGQYWAHRLGHQAPLLWRLHAMHHSVGRLYWLNTSRFHPLDTMLQFTSEVAPLVVLGASEEVIVIFTVFTSINGGLRHANIDMRFGWLNRVLSTADLHRFHHSRVLREANANYGANLIVWDSFFGTRFNPTREDHRHPVALGLADYPDFPMGYFGQLASPFRSKVWRRPSRD